MLGNQRRFDLEDTKMLIDLMKCIWSFAILSYWLLFRLWYRFFMVLLRIQICLLLPSLFIEGLKKNCWDPWATLVVIAITGMTKMIIWWKVFEGTLLSICSYVTHKSAFHWKGMTYNTCASQLINQACALDYILYTSIFIVVIIIIISLKRSQYGYCKHNNPNFFKWLYSISFNLHSVTPFFFFLFPLLFKIHLNGYLFLWFWTTFWDKRVLLCHIFWLRHTQSIDIQVTQSLESCMRNIVTLQCVLRNLTIPFIRCFEIQ